MKKKIRSLWTIKEWAASLVNEYMENASNLLGLGKT